VLSGDTVFGYDPVLAVVPLALLLGALAAHVAGVRTHVALGAAALVAALAVGDALFRNPPGTYGAASR